MHHSRPRSLLAGAVLALALTCAAAVATAGPAASAPSAVEPGPYVPGELVVGYENGRERVVELHEGDSVVATAARLERRPSVAYAAPNWIARSALTPLDGGTALTLSGWRADQWNFLGEPGGIGAERAWDRLIAARAPGGAGTTIAVVDTGVAYTATESGPAAPDFGAAQFTRGIDLVDDDARPLDENGHGTHVAGTIGEQVTLAKAGAGEGYLTGVAYGARLMAVRALDERGEGAASDVAEAILWAARHGADVINLSLQFDAEIESCKQVPGVCEATRRARRRGVLVVGAAGNALQGTGRRGALFPGAAPGVLAVGGTTEHGCIAAYSHFGSRVDLVAPGGGVPRPGAARPACAADERPVLQLTLDCFPACGSSPPAGFAIRADTGTSMAAAHTSGVAALVIASRAAGRRPSPRDLARRLTCTARNLSPERYYRAGLLDAERAVRPKFRCG